MLAARLADLRSYSDCGTTTSGTTTANSLAKYAAHGTVMTSAVTRLLRVVARATPWRAALKEASDPSTRRRMLVNITELALAGLWRSATLCGQYLHCLRIRPLIQVIPACTVIAAR